MDTEKFELGTIIKGRDLKRHTFCKVLSEDMCMRDFQYQPGINEDVKPFAKTGRCKEGLYFITMGEVLKYLHHGTKLAIISIPANEDVYVDDEKFRTHRLTVKKIMDLKDAATWKYLHKHGVDITVNDNFAVRVAAEQGNLEIIKYLHEHGSDITVNNNSAIKWASCMGHIDIVSYLYRHGAELVI